MRSGRRATVALVLAAVLAIAAPLRTSADVPVAVRYLQELRAARAALPGDVATASRDIAAAAVLAGDPAGLSPVRRALTAGDGPGAARLLDNDIAALALPDSAQAGDPSEALRRLDAVYARPPLDALTPSPDDGLAARAARALGGLIQSAGGGGHPALLALAVLLVAAALVLLVRGIRGTSAGAAATAGGDPGVAGIDTDAEWAAALAAAGRGDHREAVRRAFRSALLAVARRGRLAVDPAWTSRELLAAVRGDADLLAALAPAAAAFDVAWYSRHPVTASDWGVQRARCATVRALSGRRISSGSGVAAQEAPR